MIDAAPDSFAVCSLSFFSFYSCSVLFGVGRGSMGRTAGREADAWATRRTVKTCRPRPGFAAFAQASTHHQWHAAFLDARVAASHGAPWLARAPVEMCWTRSKLRSFRGRLQQSTHRHFAPRGKSSKFGAKRLLPACMNASQASGVLHACRQSSNHHRHHASGQAPAKQRRVLVAPIGRRPLRSMHLDRKDCRDLATCLAPHLHPSVQTCHCAPGQA